MEHLKTVFKKAVVFVITHEARAVLRKYKPQIVAVTGNVGKTSTKDAIFTVLSAKYHVRKSDKSFNSEIGVPLTILGRPNAWSSPIGWLTNIVEGALLVALPHEYPKWLVLEVGADRPGDIETAAKWLRPDISVITRLPELPVHVEFFPSAEAVRREKLTLVTHTKESGTVVGNADDTYITDAFALLPETRKRVLFGIKKEADVRAEGVGAQSSNHHILGMRGVVHGKTGESEFSVAGAIGTAQMYSALAALAVGEVAGISINLGASVMKNHETPPGRMHLIEGKGGTLIIDDTYNSSPLALEEALRSQKSMRSTRKIAVLGDMMELGEHSVPAHKKAGKDAAHLDMLVTVGVRARGIAEGAHQAGMIADRIHWFDSAKAAGEFLEKEIKNGDSILVKGSQSMRLEKLVEMLMAHPEQKKKLLVRQEEEWQKR